MLTSYCIRSEAWSGLFGSFRNIQNSAIETCRCCCPDLWTVETGCWRMPAQPTQPPKLCPPDKLCPPTSTLGHQIQPTIAHHNQIQPTIALHNQIQPTSAPTGNFNKPNWAHYDLRLRATGKCFEIFFLYMYIFIQMHTNVGEQTQPQMYNSSYSWSTRPEGWTTLVWVLELSPAFNGLG